MIGAHPGGTSDQFSTKAPWRAETDTWKSSYDHHKDPW